VLVTDIPQSPRLTEHSAVHLIIPRQVSLRPLLRSHRLPAPLLQPPRYTLRLSCDTHGPLKGPLEGYPVRNAEGSRSGGLLQSSVAGFCGLPALWVLLSSLVSCPGQIAERISRPALAIQALLGFGKIKLMVSHTGKDLMGPPT